jgi:hypothetical protein
METINIGDLVYNTKTKTEHLVESIELVDDDFIIFTDDIKCFPISDLVKLPKSKIARLFLSWFESKKLNDEDEKELDDLIKRTKPITIKICDIDEYIKEQGLK